MKTKVFSDDVIQRIASGYESSQTLISMDVIKKVLKPHEMRNVLGGSDSGHEDCMQTTQCNTGLCAARIELIWQGEVLGYKVKTIPQKCVSTDSFCMCVDK